LILDGLMAVQDAEIAFSPGFRWGTTLLPGENITMEALMDQTAITYPYTTVTAMSGETIKTILEDVADNLFNPDPYYQQGGDMVRVGGLQYTIAPNQPIGKRITNMRLAGQPIDANKSYKVAGWAPVAEASRNAGGAPIWDVMAQWLRTTREVDARPLNLPTIEGMRGNPGMDAS
jgi:sulfur-oxidizing protein SoxB